MPVATGKGGLKLVIATSPTPVEDGSFLCGDLEMVRSALLYADTVDPFPAAMMIGGVAALHDLETDGWLRMFEQFR